jgi:hypothetical protein
MSVCSPCFDSGISVAACNGGIQFGYVTPEESYTITLTHNATKRMQTFIAQSELDGTLMIEGAKIDALQGYTIRLDGCAKFTICEVEYTCITFSVVNSNADAEDVGVINLIDCIEC